MIQYLLLVAVIFITLGVLSQLGWFPKTWGTIGGTATLGAGFGWGTVPQSTQNQVQTSASAPIQLFHADWGPSVAWMNNGVVRDRVLISEGLKR